jgi:hypothetical protein
MSKSEYSIMRNFVKSVIFWDITSCSPLKVNRRFGGIYRLHLQVGEEAEHEISMKAGGKQNSVYHSCSAYSPTLKIEAIGSSETSVDFQRTTRLYRIQ